MQYPSGFRSRDSEATRKTKDRLGGGNTSTNRVDVLNPEGNALEVRNGFYVGCLKKRSTYEEIAISGRRLLDIGVYAERH